jgi:hypothetical protein
MNSREIVLFIIGIIFTIIGVISSKKARWRKFKTYVPIIVGLILCYLSTIGPLSKSKSQLNKIIAINSSAVNSMTFQFSENSGGALNSKILGNKIISKRNEINHFCSKLRLATIEGEDFVKNAKKIYQVKIHFKNSESLYFSVKKSSEATCIKLNSNGEFGWHYGNLRANEFGLLIDSLEYSFNKKKNLGSNN